jgi:L-threonylcarbamoyladenylate synthase
LKIGFDIKKAHQILANSGIVGIPTETVYGLAANALDSNAILRVFEAKNRPKFDPLIMHLKGVDVLEEFVHCNEEELKIVSTLSPGPITYLFPKKENVNDLVTAGSQLVAIRIPNHPVTKSLLNSIDFPVVAPSANPFGYVSPSTAEHVIDSLGEKVDYVLDGGSCELGIESTIISFDLKNNTLKVHRLGAISLEDLSSLTGCNLVLDINNNSNPQAPGMLDKHYAPTCKLLVYDQRINVSNETVIWFGKNAPSSKNTYNLSVNGDLKEASKNLFSTLRILDNSKIKKAYVKLVPDKGLGRAINDRLRRAMA